MKAILVIDMPNHCSKCPCWDRDYPVCCVLNKENKSKDYGHRPKWCPLKPLPQKKYVNEEIAKYDNDYDEQIGWNDCIDEILGEKE